MIVVENVTKEGFARKSLSFEIFECFGSISLLHNLSIIGHYMVKICQ